MTKENKRTHNEKLNLLINTLSLIIVPTAIPFAAYTIGLSQHPMTVLISIVINGAFYLSPIYLSKNMTYNEIRTFPFLFASVIYSNGAFGSHTFLLIAFSILLATTLIYNIACKKSENHH